MAVTPMLAVSPQNDAQRWGFVSGVALGFPSARNRRLAFC